MPRTAIQNKEIKDKRRLTFLAAALKVFANMGYDEVVVDDITKETECSHGLFYHYFSTKEDIFESMVKEVVLPSPVFPPLEKALEAKGVAGLRLLCDYIDRIQDAKTKEVRVAYIVGESIVSADMPLELPEIAKALDYRPAVKELIRQGQEAGEVIDGNPEEIAAAMCDMVAGSLARRRIYKKETLKVSGSVVMGLLLKRPL